MTPVRRRWQFKGRVVVVALASALAAAGCDDLEGSDGWSDVVDGAIGTGEQAPDPDLPLDGVTPPADASSPDDVDPDNEPADPSDEESVPVESDEEPVPDLGGPTEFPVTDLGAARGGELTDVTAGMGVSIGVNPGDVTQYVDQIDRAGFNWVRTRLHWESIEGTRGVYDWRAGNDPERIVETFNERGIGVVFAMSFSNGLYQGASPPYNENGIDRYGDFAAAAADHFRGEKVIFELGNEPNITNFWPVDGDGNGTVSRDEVQAAARAYARLARQVVPRMRAADANVYVTGPGLAGRGGQRYDGVIGAEIYAETLVAEGAVDIFDAFSLHGYTAEHSNPTESHGDGHAPEDADLDLYRELLATPDLPLLNTEHGWRTDGGDGQNRLAASYNIRDYLYGISRGVSMRVWYAWDGENREAWRIRDRPASVATAVLDRELGGFTYAGRVDTGHPDQYVFEYRNAMGETRLAAWTVNPSTPGVVRYPASTDATEVDVLGSTATLSSDGSAIELDLDIHPVYIRLS